MNWKSFLCSHDWRALRTTSGDENNIYPSRVIAQCSKCGLQGDGKGRIRLCSEINNDISRCGQAGKISDGYHTFDELYEHRCLLFLALVNSNKVHGWKARANADGTKWDGWFILGLFPKDGKQITYHLPEKYWAMADVTEFEVNPFYDGHNSKDITIRLGAFHAA